MLNVECFLGFMGRAGVRCLVYPSKSRTVARCTLIKRFSLFALDGREGGFRLRHGAKAESGVSGRERKHEETRKCKK
jgi:hypothetical protein